ncbi:MAG: nucleoside/nucleotide kinase family protein [Pseudomonadota bacterium]
MAAGPTSDPVSPDAFVEAVTAWAQRIPRGSREVLAIAGAPGSGKSTLAARIEADISDTAILPMDGYHYDDELLVPRGDRPRKGAPHTFDVGGYRVMLARLRANDEDEIAVPRFDRDLEIVRSAARVIPRSVRLIVTEGNWLLLDQPPWSDLQPLFDRTAFLDVPIEELDRRLRQRWDGYNLTGDALRAKLEDNDLPNARLAATGSITPHWTVQE